jgi:hypothetical protein
MDDYHEFKCTHDGHIEEWGPFIVGVFKRNVSSQNYFQNTTLSDHYIYEIIFLVDFFVH